MTFFNDCRSREILSGHSQQSMNRKLFPLSIWRYFAQRSKRDSAPSQATAVIRKATHVLRCVVPAVPEIKLSHKPIEDLLDREPKTQSETSHRAGPIARTIEQQTAKLP